MKIRDVLADEVMDFGPAPIGIRPARPPVLKFLSLPGTPFRERRHIADRRVEPDVPAVFRAVGDLESEVGGRPRHVPFPARLAEEMSLSGIGDLGLQMLSRLRP